MTAPAQPVAPVEDRIETAGGVRLAVRRWRPSAQAGSGGRGPAGRDAEPSAAVPVLAVHGLASNARMWDGVAAHLVKLGHAVAAVDLRGHGRSDKPDDGYDFATLTGDLTDVVTALGWTRAGPLPLVAGQSFGANLAIELAIRHPGTLSAVACIDGGTIELSAQFPDWEQARASLTPPRLEGMPAADFEAALRAMHPDWPETGIQGALGNVEVRPDGTVTPWLSLQRHLAILRQLWEHRPSERYHLVPVPVLLIPADGGDGAWASARRAAVARAEAAMPKVRTQWLAGDHDLHAQFPATVAELLDEACRPQSWS